MQVIIIIYISFKKLNNIWPENIQLKLNNEENGLENTTLEIYF